MFVDIYTANPKLVIDLYLLLYLLIIFIVLMRG